jgi:hypothetical protein
MGEPTAERGGRAKRSFHLTGAGNEAVNRVQQDLLSMLHGIAFPLPEGGK